VPRTRVLGTIDIPEQGDAVTEALLIIGDRQAYRWVNRVETVDLAFVEQDRFQPADISIGVFHNNFAVCMAEVDNFAECGYDKSLKWAGEISGPTDEAQSAPARTPSTPLLKASSMISSRSFSWAR
jgi:hypothetical protein